MHYPYAVVKIMHTRYFKRGMRQQQVRQRGFFMLPTGFARMIQMIAIKLIRLCWAIIICCACTTLSMCVFRVPVLRSLTFDAGNADTGTTCEREQSEIKRRTTKRTAVVRFPLRTSVFHLALVNGGEILVLI